MGGHTVPTNYLIIFTPDPASLWRNIFAFVVSYQLLKIGQAVREDLQCMFHCQYEDVS